MDGLFCSQFSSNWRLLRIINKEQRGKRYGAIFVSILTVSFIGLLWAILYLSLRSSPSLSSVDWLPSQLTQWADRNGEFRTFVPYCFASLLLVAIAFFMGKFCIIPAALEKLCILAGGSGLLTLLTLTELAQLALEQRVASWADLGWGSLGIALGMIAGKCILRVFPTPS